ncbi:MAG: hypothetical protein ABS62_01370 [Microbacterium sp. SCN 70-200]|uniref:hypothetical protein n=1 Tax=unclassified Microbacterium TaxID=2609290 RepID=UPI00086B8CE2|nr:MULTISPECIES: hypothetical protein [unclassified Microbacterium]MBN9215138.1 hypothetical protein [Microbacterium sp.]ODT42562.1 MAG: hypothetical protein ABS62_01370 [Microbacterium sp. SCN 70-200]OJV80095.1 MAG: hypothetical protein BGO46_07660 [Microbacterium sp. 70-16]
MDELAAEIWRWLIPALVVFGGTAVLATVAIWLLRRSRRSPAARASAEAERTAAGSALVRLDDAIDELALEVGLSGALYDGTAPDTLRRARMTAEHARDASFEQLRALTPETHPDEVRRVARGIRARTESALATIDAARAEHTAWMTRNVSAAAQVEAARSRARALHAELGDPAPLLATLAERYDRSEWVDAERSAVAAAAALAAAERLIDEAATRAADPTRSALPLLADAERALRGAQAESRRFEERHRLATDASAAVDGEISAARGALREANAVRGELESDDAARLGAVLTEVAAALDAVEADAARRPTAAVTAIARLRDRLDLAVGDARTAQQRLKGARSALPGALAAARDQIARAEPRMPAAGADARVRLGSAQRELAAARGAANPVDALDAARRALRHAEDAVALADYDARF